MKWVKWEKKTKQLYQEMYQELMNIGEVAAAKFISCYVCDVDCELKYAERKHLDLEAVSYDLGAVVSEQHELHEKYRCMLEHLDLSM